MTRRHRIAEHLDSLHADSLRLCPATGPCACRGCAGFVNGTKVRAHEMQLYLEGKLFDGQVKRQDKIKHEIFQQLRAQGFNPPKD